jgi:hypothetical protein
VNQQESICGPPAAPGSQDWVQRADRIACGHMSGLLSRSHVTAAKMGSATRDPNIAAALQAAHGFRGESRVLGSIDHAICSGSSKLSGLSAQRFGAARRTASCEAFREPFLV